MNKKYIADVTTSNGTEPFNTTPMNILEILDSLWDAGFAFDYENISRIQNQFQVQTTTATIDILPVAE